MLDLATQSRLVHSWFEVTLTGTAAAIGMMQMGMRHSADMWQTAARPVAPAVPNPVAASGAGWAIAPAPKPAVTSRSWYRAPDAVRAGPELPGLPGWARDIPNPLALWLRPWALWSEAARRSAGNPFDFWSGLNGRPAPNFPLLPAAWPGPAPGIFPPSLWPQSAGSGNPWLQGLAWWREAGAIAQQWTRTATAARAMPGLPAFAMWPVPGRQGAFAAGANPWNLLVIGAAVLPLT